MLSVAESLISSCKNVHTTQGILWKIGDIISTLHMAYHKTCAVLTLGTRIKFPEWSAADCTIIGS